MSRDQLTHKESEPEPTGERIVLLGEEGEELGPLRTWARCAPIRLAGYEDDPTETHILRSID